MEFKALKCQSCGNGELDFRTYRVAKCPSCGTVNIIVGDEKVCQDLQALNLSQEGHRIRICLKIAIGLFLREQGYIIDDHGLEYDRLNNEINDRSTNYCYPWDTRIIDDDSPLYVYSLGEIEFPVVQVRWFRSDIVTMQKEKRAVPIGFIDFNSETPIFYVSGRKAAKAAEEVMDILLSGLKFQIEAQLRFS